MVEATTKRRYWTPNYEIAGRYEKFHPPVEVRAWAFKPKSGRIVNLDAKYRVVDNLTDAQRPKAWFLIKDSVENPNKFIELSWEQVQTVTKLCRERDWPIKKAVAATINRDDYLKAQLTALVESPEVYLTGTSRGETTTVEKVSSKATDAYFDAVAKEAAPKAAAAPAKTEPKAG